MKENYRHGKLVTIKKISKRSKKLKQQAKWLCKCDCGREIITNESHLHGNKMASCGCYEYKNKKLVGSENYDELIREKIKKNTKINENECWEWQCSKHKQGYGNLNYKRTPSLAHRVSWIVYKGKIPKGIKVCHTCDNTSCVNPEHLFLGTQKDNIKDAVSKGKFANRPIGKRRNKLNWDQVQEIKKLHAEGKTRKELEKLFSVGQTCIAKILQGKSWNTKWI